MSPVNVFVRVGVELFCDLSWCCVGGYDVKRVDVVASVNGEGYLLLT